MVQENQSIWKKVKYTQTIKTLLLNGANINTRFDIKFKNETLLNTNFKRLSVSHIQLLVDNNFDFVKLGNLPNMHKDTPLSALAMYSVAQRNQISFYNDGIFIVQCLFSKQ